MLMKSTNISNTNLSNAKKEILQPFKTFYSNFDTDFYVAIMLPCLHVS